MIEAIIFDMDGLLVDSERVWYIAEQELIRSHGHEFTLDVRNSIVGLRVDEFLERIRSVYNLEPDVPALAADLEARMLALIPREVRAQPGAQAVIDYVQTSGMPRAIASSSPMSIIDVTLGSQGWDEVFAVRCSAEDDKRGKPAPDVYLRTAHTLGIEPSACLALEDSPTGARAAVAAGMTCYAVPDPVHTDPDAFKDVTPHIFSDLNAVLERLRA